MENGGKTGSTKARVRLETDWSEIQQFGPSNFFFPSSSGGMMPDHLTAAAMDKHWISASVSCLCIRLPDCHFGLVQPAIPNHFLAFSDWLKVDFIKIWTAKTAWDAIFANQIQTSLGGCLKFNSYVSAQTLSKWFSNCLLHRSQWRH